MYNCTMHIWYTYTDTDTDTDILILILILCITYIGIPKLGFGSGPW